MREFQDITLKRYNILIDTNIIKHPPLKILLVHTYTYMHIPKIIREKEPINLRVEGMRGLKRWTPDGGNKGKGLNDVIQFQLKMHIIFKN